MSKCNRVGCRTKRAADCLCICGCQKLLPKRTFLLGQRQLHHAARKRRQCIGEAVVSMYPCNFFDKIDLTFQIEPPAWQRYGILFRRNTLHVCTQRGEISLDRRRIERLAIDGFA